MAKADGKSRDAEMNRNQFNRNPAGTESQRDQPADSSGKSSSRSRSTKSGADRAESASSGRGGAGAPSGTSSNTSDKKHFKKRD